MGHHGHLKSDDNDIKTVKMKVALGTEVPPCCMAAGFSPVTIRKYVRLITRCRICGIPVCVGSNGVFETTELVPTKRNIYEKSSRVSDISLILHSEQIKAEYHFSNVRVF